MPYPVVEVPSDASTQLEQLGTKSKFWYTDQDRGLVLFKEGRPGTGENWAEKVSCEICRALGLPHAAYDLASWRDRRGVITPTFVPSGCRLVHGNEVLAVLVTDYDAGKRFRAKQHNVARVMAIAKALAVPLNWHAPAGIENGADVFVGYLMLDVLIGNQDRHHENWGLLASAENISLAPTFDHASSLGRNENDVTRVERLTTRDQGRSVAAFVARASSAFYEMSPETPGKPLSTLEAYSRAATLAPMGAAHWLDCLASLDRAVFQQIVADIPTADASLPAREFALGMLFANADSLLRYRL